MLDNLYNWMSSDDEYSFDYISDPDHYTRLYDPDAPPDWLLYTQSFDIFLNVTVPPPRYVIPNDTVSNSAPYFLVKPSDLDF